MIREIIQGLKVHNEFIFFNTYIHFFVGVFIALAVYPFLSKKLKLRYNYIFLIFFPAVFGSIFPDLMFIVSTLVKQRSLYGLFDLLSTGGDVYTTFHFGFPLVLVVPCTFFIVMVVNRIFKKSFDNFPKWGLFWLCLLSLFSALFHIYLDGVGF